MYRRNYGGGGFGGRRGGGRFKIMLIIGACYAAYAIFQYYSNTEYNELLGEKQQVGISIDQEITLGLQSAPQMIQQYGGLHPDQEAQDLLDEVGTRLIDNSIAKSTNYKYDFHLLADENTVNAFALPGGQCFITAALFGRLENEDQLAGVIGHEIGHVVARHGAERIAKQQLTQGLTGAAVMAAGDYSTAQAAQMIGNMINMKYGRDQELQSDELGVRFMIEAGYNPEELKGVMRILKAAAGGGERQPEFFSSHPDPENRSEKIDEAIEKYKNLEVQFQ